MLRRASLSARGVVRHSSIGPLYGATGRPDLLGEEHTDALVLHQHASAYKLADLLADQGEVFPTHGFGSFCAAT